MNRREFLRCAGLALAGAGCAGVVPDRTWASEDVVPPSFRPDWPRTSGRDERFVRPALFSKPVGGKKVECQLCPRLCRVIDRERGYCGVRENREGEYYTLVYGRACSLNNDPIEKKPLNHFLPGTMALSVATAGCNVECKFCQNWQISQFRPEQVEAYHLPPADLVRLARDKESASIAYTYSEPVIFYEYMFETARLGQAAGLKSVVISNGYINPEPIKALAPHLDAYKVDLKAFTEKFYRDYCHGRLKPVLQALETLVALELWVEIVVLILPTVNDSEAEIKAMARWIKTNLGPMIPVHFIRFYPAYKIRNLPPTPVTTLEHCHAAAKAEGLKYVYVGNVPGHPDGNTYCHQCGRLLIHRVGLWAVDSKIEGGRCPRCQTDIPGVWA